ncbi:MAG TPA: tRNA lysidine(34) synthetase TilS [Terriglobia bacterium]|nr:tRNA lysidine(34) synthetase TilS [Terriglobia bacterium]
MTDARAHRNTGTFARWRLALRRARLFHAGERVGVAVSGGQDSMLLLAFMCEQARERGLQLAVVHFNHHLRGSESNEDERFVQEQARRLGLEYIGAGADVARRARERKRNLEATARDLRYAFFFSLLRQRQLDKIATAHTANDQAETVLLRLVRGAGTRGLGGIHPVLAAAPGSVVRPFLDLTRDEVEAEVARRGLAFRVDSSNQDPRLRRNRMRHQVLPLLEREFNPQVVRALAGFADRARDDEALLEGLARERALPFLVRDEAWLKIPCARLDEFPPALARRVLRRMVLEAPRTSGVKPAVASSAAVAYTGIEVLRRFAREQQSGKRLLLPGGVEARKEFEWLMVGRKPSSGGSEGRSEGFAYAVRPPAEIDIPELRLRLRFGLGDMRDAERAEPGYTILERVWLDPGCLEAAILRNWRPGDRLRLAGSEKPVKLKDLFQRRRVPLRERRHWPLLECAGGIVWARGFGPSAGSKVTEACRVWLTVREERLEPNDGALGKL